MPQGSILLHFLYYREELAQFEEVNFGKEYEVTPWDTKDCKDVRISTISTASTEHIYAEIEKTDLTPSHSTTNHLGTFSTLKKQTLKKQPTNDSVYNTTK